uniref:Uncharacterized protein n=1 Tax=Oryza rufipogon TaxID=4529 RepID=A0A0E0QGP5_ORYRU
MGHGPRCPICIATSQAWDPFLSKTEDETKRSEGKAKRFDSRFRRLLALITPPASPRSRRWPIARRCRRYVARSLLPAACWGELSPLGFLRRKETRPSGQPRGGGAPSVLTGRSTARRHACRLQPAAVLLEDHYPFSPVGIVGWGIIGNSPTLLI